MGIHITLSTARRVRDGILNFQNIGRLLNDPYEMVGGNQGNIRVHEER